MAERTEATQMLQALDEYLVDLDNKRLGAQEDLNGKCVRIEEGIEEMREALQKEVNDAAGKEEARLLDCIRDIEGIGVGRDCDAAGLQQKLRRAVLRGMRCLRGLQSYEVVSTTRAERVRPYELFAVRVTSSGSGSDGKHKYDDDDDDYNEDEDGYCTTTATTTAAAAATTAERTGDSDSDDDMMPGDVCTRLKEAVNRQDELRAEAVCAIDDGCNALMDSVGALRGNVNESLEGSYKEVFERTQGHIHKVGECVCEEEMEGVLKGAQDDITFCVEYGITDNKENKGVEDLYVLAVTEKVWGLSEMKPVDVCATAEGEKGVRVVFELVSKRGWSSKKSVWAKQGVCAKVSYCEGGGEWKEQEMNGGQEHFVPDYVEPGKSYKVKVRVVFGEEEREWSDEAEFTGPVFREGCVWKECPEFVDEEMAYCVEEGKPRAARKKMYGRDMWSTVIGNMPLPPNKETSWSILLTRSRDNDGSFIYIGVTPFDTDQNGSYYSYNMRGWYFDCWGSTLHSGPPHKYSYKGYGPRKNDGEYVHTGDSVGVVMDTAKGELSFVVNGVYYGVAYEGKIGRAHV